MTKLAITPELLVQALFEGTQPDLHVTGATFDAVRAVIVLEVEGPGVPVAGEVIALVHRQPSLRVEFRRLSCRECGLTAVHTSDCPNNEGATAGA